MTKESDSTAGAHTNKRHGQQTRREDKRTRKDKQTRTGETRRGSGRPERVAGAEKGKGRKRKKVETKAATQWSRIQSSKSKAWKRQRHGRKNRGDERSGRGGGEI